MTWGTAALIFSQGMPYHTQDAMHLIRILLLVLTVRLLGQFPITVSSYLMLIPLLYIEMNLRFIRLSFWSETQSFFVFALIVDMGGLLYWQTGKCRQFFLALSILALISSAMLVVYDSLIATKFLTFYYNLGRAMGFGVAVKILLLVLASLLFMAVFAGSIGLVGRLLKKRESLFQLVTEKFGGLEVYILLFVSISLQFFYVLSNLVPINNKLAVRMEIFLIMMNVAYICLLLKVASVKEKIQEVQNDKNSILAYQNDLETTLDDMREIRHDVKNLFLTMGNFVERSEDREMKEFYYGNVTPFIRGTVIKSELHDKLKLLSDDRLKSFFYYKLTEMIDEGLTVRLEITTSLSLEEGYGDIVRLFGIFIDNAAQEAALTETGSVSIKISGEEIGTGIRIGNDVRPEKRKSGIAAGTTDKGLGRGKGLLIAQKILSQYDNLFLNSYFTEYEFVQYLVLVKK